MLPIVINIEIQVRVRAQKNVLEICVKVLKILYHLTYSFVYFVFFL